MAGNEIVHGIVAGAIYSGLVSNGRKGVYQGVLAESWDASEDFRVWTFTLRRGLTFENGDAITSETLLRSWRRISRRLREQNSRGDLFSRLHGERLDAPRGMLPGITITPNSLTLRFSESFPTLLDILSEPLYSVVHPSCISSDSANWLCRDRPLASGPYRIIRWDKHQIELALRTDYPPQFAHPHPLQRIVMMSGRPNRDAAALVYGLSADGLERRGMNFHGAAQSGIVFARCLSWTLPAGPCHSRDDRVALRESLYSELALRGLKPVRSFFPVAMGGISEFDAPIPTPPGPRRKSVSVAPIAGRYAFLASCGEAAKAAVERLGWLHTETDTSASQRFRELEPGLPVYSNDLVFFMTEITLGQVEDTVRYMFRANDGARLPDASGRIEMELERHPLDLQRINELLWNDALIWPVAHVGFGTWAQAGFDFSLVNLGRVSTPIAWIGRKT